MNSACTVIIDGESWYIPCDRVNDIGFDTNGNLVVLTSSSLTLYKSYSASNTTSYPRISCNYGRVCTLQTEQNNTRYLTNSTLEIGERALTDSFFSTCMLGIICLGVVLWHLLKR